MVKQVLHGVQFILTTSVLDVITVIPAPQRTNPLSTGFILVLMSIKYRVVFIIQLRKIKNKVTQV